MADLLQPHSEQPAAKAPQLAYLRRCLTCRFWRPFGAGRFGQCTEPVERARLKAKGWSTVTGKSGGCDQWEGR